ncbi:unnamed protein product [Prunus armeniaca]
MSRRHNPGATRIHCPRRRCNNTLWETIENVGFHLVRNGMIETYSIWNFHGEQLYNASSLNATRVDNVEPIVDPNEQVMDIINDVFLFASTTINQEGEDDVPTPMDSVEFEQYEQLLKNANQELFPGCDSFSVLTAIMKLMHRKIKYSMSNLCFDYFLGVFKRMLPTNNCLPKDHRYAQKVLNGLGLGYEKIHACKNNCMLFYKEYETLDTCPICKESRFKMTSQNRTTKIPQKVMRYLPLRPRLQRLYMSIHTATDMSLHKKKRVDDDVMRHPADGRHGQSLIKHSLSLLLIPEMLYWDLPLTDSIRTGTKGYMACPVCKEDITFGWHARKVCYLGYRRWLPWDHEWRENDKEFDGNTEHRLRPREWFSDEILE